MAVRIPGFVGKPVVGHDLAANEGFEGQGGEHVEAETTRSMSVQPLRNHGGGKSLQPSDIDHDVVGWKVVEDVALGFVAKSKETC